MRVLQDLVARHTRGEATGIWSLCSAHPEVIESAMREAGEAGTALLVEATSNQVNQFGGYTGMRPADFVRFLHGIAGRAGFPADRIWIGGDHIGPNAWKDEPADAAMGKAVELVRGYVTAGFRKIHLDCSMACSGDAALSEELVAARAADLAVAAEEASRLAAGEPPVYVIGTEVPTPGGAQEDLSTLAVTTPAAAAATLEAHRAAFVRAGLEDAWPRVIALVVQPGVEFDHHKVIAYRPEQARSLSEFIGRQSQVVCEAHSTDYQPAGALRSLVRDHFAILKVGPGATFALREALWGLAAIEQALHGDDGEPDLRKAVVATMRADPQHWRGYYREGPRLDFDLQYSLSDRIRYYWPYPEVQRAVARMRQRLDRQPIPMTLLSQFLPRQHDAVREGRIPNGTAAILREGVAAALRPYFAACMATPTVTP